MGKTWLSIEVGRKLAGEHGHLVGYAESLGPDLLLRAVADLYAGWLANASYRQQAMLLWRQHQGKWIEKIAQAVGSIFDGLGKAVTPEGVGKLIKQSLDAMVTANANLRSGKLELAPIDYETAHDLVSVVADLSRKEDSSQPITLILDAWEQSPSMEFEYKALAAFLSQERVG
jgi:hypothetical protein